MNREEAIKIFQLMKIILSIPNSDAARTIEAIDMAIEALTSQNLSKPNNTCEVDLISRADAIEAVRKCGIQDVGDWAMLVDKAEAILALNALPSVEAYFTDGNKIAEWIPCSERLPHAEYGEGDSVLCCTELGLMYILYWDGGNWCVPTGEPYHWVNHKTGWHNKVIAWMPLQKPYREDGEA